MTFNLWHGGERSGLELDKTAAVIREANCDVVGLQEVASLPIHDDAYDRREDNTSKIASLLGDGWNYFEQGILTPWLPLKHKHPQAFIFRGRLLENSPLKWGVKIERSDGRCYWIFNAHFAYWPYQPYQLLHIPYEDSKFLDSEESAIESARNSRARQVDELLAEISSVQRSEPSTPIFITGDFNEPSHSDWTQKAADAKLHPLKVEWPTARAIEKHGFVDCYRALYSDEVTHSGRTWCTQTASDDPRDHHDRLDFVFVHQQHRVTLRSVVIIGEKDGVCDLVVRPYPSDHRAVVAEFAL
jgi:endonuclease/exonuclease/phosphatase family metal-dependent hydrolase